MRRFQPQQGVTLLELIISLALSGLLFAMITQMIGNHFHVLEKQRDNVEEVQLARALLSRMSQDIKSAVQYNGVDVEAGLGDIDVQGALEIASGAGMGMEDLLGAADSLLSSSDSTTSYDFQTTFPTSLGMYGDQQTLRVDISRIPRQEEYRAMYDPTEIGVLQ
ncbi:MAG: type II secretion system protein, partial [Planctomycetaceae bacterium]|nr:type II secretion system protein [Planctomycetaceae bacterium]